MRCTLLANYLGQGQRRSPANVITPATKAQGAERYDAEVERAQPAAQTDAQTRQTVDASRKLHAAHYTEHDAGAEARGKRAYGNWEHRATWRQPHFNDALPERRWARSTRPTRTLPARAFTPPHPSSQRRGCPARRAARPPEGCRRSLPPRRGALGSPGLPPIGRRRRRPSRDRPTSRNRAGSGTHRAMLPAGRRGRPLVEKRPGSAGPRGD
mmetsp:Transcript_19226/g.62770  ORF Transcript_19226/g.62770 Transcript_19226/m.62770 type:complete len:212 (+) Transcript_19226:165-800(+)|eukprot:scaffold15143_cov103-Isochrysis_galbana.AAC.4